MFHKTHMSSFQRQKPWNGAEEITLFLHTQISAILTEFLSNTTSPSQFKCVGDKWNGTTQKLEWKDQSAESFPFSKV